MKHLAALLLFCTAVTSIAIPSMKLRDSSGKLVAFKSSNTKPTVLIFVLSDCPIANNYAPEFGRIMAKYGKNFDIRLIFEDPDISLSTAKKHMSDYLLKLPFLLDPKHKLARKLEVKFSPEVVILQKGKRIYLGRIDDQYPELGVRRPEATSHDLRDALEAVIHKTAVHQPTAATVGCILPR